MKHVENQTIIYLSSPAGKYLIVCKQRKTGETALKIEVDDINLTTIQPGSTQNTFHCP